MSKSTLSKTVSTLQGRGIMAAPDHAIMVEAMNETVSILTDTEHQSFKELRILRKQVKSLKHQVADQQVIIDSFTPSTALINQAVAIHNQVYPEFQQLYKDVK